MTAIRSIDSFDVEEVAIWLQCIGLGSYAGDFRANGVDGGLLLDLSLSDLTTDLGLSSLQAKKVLRQIDFTKSLSSSADSARVAELEKKVADLEAENQALKAKLAQAEPDIKVEPVATPVVKGEPVKTKPPSHHTTYSSSHHSTHPTNPPYTTTTTACHSTEPYYGEPVPEKKKGGVSGAAKGAVGGAAGGALKGAVGGAVMGAVLPGMTAGEGAKAGAAGGAAMGGMRGMFRGARRY